MGIGHLVQQQHERQPRKRWNGVRNRKEVRGWAAQGGRPSAYLQVLHQAGPVAVIWELDEASKNTCSLTMACMGRREGRQGNQCVRAGVRLVVGCAFG